MPDTSLKLSPSPGTACLGCRRRKLKCSRESEGCSNCSKSDLPCVYPAPETGVKRKRGPYKKDKPARERHLEDLVKYLEPRVSPSDNKEQSQSVYPGATPKHTRDNLHVAEGAFRATDLESAAHRKPGNAEDLVKDALTALTRSSLTEKDAIGDSGDSVSITLQDAGDSGFHPSARRVFEYWLLFETRVDPLLKILHCPTFRETILVASERPKYLDAPTKTLLYSTYYAAVASCTAHEARKRFGESRQGLLQRYSRVLEAALSDNYTIPALESLQALVIYLITLRRNDSTSNGFRALFSLAVRMAQLIGLHKDPANGFSPFVSEMRRRLWWQICGLESRGAEEGAARQNSIMDGCDVRLPANLNDIDLGRDAGNHPQPRSGATDMTWVLVRCEMQLLILKLAVLRKKHENNEQDTGVGEVKSEQMEALEKFNSRMETAYRRHLHESRPLDWLCIGYLESMTTKARLMIDFPPGQISTNEMSAKQRFDLLQASVDIIRWTHSVKGHEACSDWLWFFRDWTQWHSVAIVIAELGASRNSRFAASAWEALDPVLADWEMVYSAKREEPAWEHVNTLIERARKMRQQILSVHQGDVSATVSTREQTGWTDQVTRQSKAPTQGVSDTRQGVSKQSDSNSPGRVFQQLEGAGYSMQPFANLGSTTVPFHNGCAPALPGFEGDFGFVDNLGLDNIDFSAFDAVFGDSAWYASSPSTDTNMELYNT